MSKINRKLQVKLSAGILLMAMPIFVVAMTVMFIQSRNSIREEAGEHAASMLSATMHHMKKYILATEMATNANAWFVEQKFQPDSLLVLAQRIVRLNGNMHSCTISAAPDMFPEYGRYFSVYAARKGDSIVATREQDYEYFDRQWYKEPIAKGDGCWVEPYFEHTEGTIRLDETVLSFCKPLYDKNHSIGPNGKKRVVGVLCIDLPFSVLADAMNAVKPDFPDSYYVMLGSNGRYLIHPDSSRLFRKSIASELDPNTQADLIAVGHEMIAGKQGHMHAMIKGRNCHITYMPMPSSKWSIALVCPDSEILKSYNQLLYLIIAIIVCGLGVIYWLTRRVVGHMVRPVNELADATQLISEGHFDTKLQYTKRADVVGRLQNSFVVMQQSLDDHLSSIRKATIETRHRNEELVTAMKMAEEGIHQKNRFIQNVSHQIRTPLNIIQGFAQVLEENRDMPAEEMKEIRSMMKYNAMHLNRMVVMLFDSSDTGVIEGWNTQLTDQISCNEVARESIRYTESHFPGLSIRFETEVPDSLHIVTNHLYLLRSLRELLYNSAKYSDFSHISLHVSQTEATVRFTTEDIGPGLSTEQLKQVFTPFNKFDDLSEGLGIGLSLARRHIINLGGDLQLDTDYHDGCRFIIIMPK